MKQDVKQELAAALKKMKMAEGPLIRGRGIGPTCVTCTDFLSPLRCVCVLRRCSYLFLLQSPCCPLLLPISLLPLAGKRLQRLTRLRMVLCAAGFRLLLAVCSPLRQPSG